MPKGEWGRNHKGSHGKHGWFTSTEPSYSFLLKSDAVKQWADVQSSPSIMKARLYDLRIFLDHAGFGPEELLELPEAEIVTPLLGLIKEYREQGKEARGKRIYYSVRGFLEFNDKTLNLKRQVKAQILRTSLKKIQQQYIPSKVDVYRMADSAMNPRDRAIVLCLWASGVRGGCLCRWRYEMVKDQLFGSDKPSYPLKITITSREDRKISHYGLDYYVTFIVHEAADELKNYLEWRMKEGWVPKDEDVLFVTHGNVSKDQTLSPQSLNEIVKFLAERAGLDPKRVWPHCLRKAFRKILYVINEDVAEALMGHRLPGSRGNYFDYHDIDFIMKDYLSADWSRTESSQFTRMEAEIEKAKQNGSNKEQEITELKNQLNELSTQLVKNDQVLVAMENFLSKFPIFIGSFDGKPGVIKDAEFTQALKDFRKAVEPKR